MRIIIAVLLLACLMPLASPPAESMEIYVRNKVLRGEAIRQGNEIYVQAREFQALIGGDLAWDEQSGIISVNGKPTTLKVTTIHNKIFMPLYATAAAMGYEVAFNKTTGILDVFKKTALKTSPAVSPTGSTPQGSPAPGQTDDKKELLTIVEKGNSVAPDATARDLRIFAEVTNGRKTDATGVIATCVLKTQDGTVFNQQDVPVGTLTSGEKKEVMFYFPSGGGGMVLQRAFSVKGN